MKNENKQPDDKFRDIDNHLQSCMDKGIEAYQKGLTKYDNDHDPGSLSFDAWDAGFKLAEKEFGNKPESKEVESVPVKSAEEILENVFPITLGILGIGWHQIDDEQKQDLISAMETYASQFKQPANNEAVKVIEDEIKALEKYDTGTITKPAKVAVLRKILKSIKQ